MQPPGCHVLKRARKIRFNAFPRPADSSAQASIVSATNVGNCCAAVPALPAAGQ
jgi:hypothetical protein